MKRSLAISLLLLCAVWVQAQAYPSQSPSQSSPSQSSPSSSQATSQGSGAATQATVQGCLSGSKDNYTLTDSSGTTYKLTGDTSKLSEHIGHKVEITGNSASASSGAGSSSGTPSSAGAASSGEQSLDVSSVKMISETCKSPSR